MDLLFKRYASPLILLDQMILMDCLPEFIDELCVEINEEKLWDLYINDILKTTSFNEYKRNLNTPSSNNEFKEGELEGIIKKTMSMKNKFKPQ